MHNISLGNRLHTVAEKVRCGAVFADIGTDHAYLPIYLLQCGKIKRAVCADVNEGPLASAEKNAREYGVSDKIDFLLSDGFSAFSNISFTDVAICGMGGELILDIITRGKSLFSENVRLILQPMTRQSVLRRGLFNLGFEIAEEEYSFEKGKYYLTLVASYTGKKREISDIEAELGIELERGALTDSKIGYLKAKRRSLVKSISGIHASGKSVADKEKLLNKIDEILDLRGT